MNSTALLSLAPRPHSPAARKGCTAAVAAVVLLFVAGQPLVEEVVGLPRGHGRLADGKGVRLLGALPFLLRGSHGGGSDPGGPESGRPLAVSSGAARGRSQGE